MRLPANGERAHAPVWAPQVIAALSEKGVLLREEAYEHKYPYDWRTKKPTIFRATAQWFVSVDGFREAALKAAAAALVGDLALPPFSFSEEAAAEAF